MDLKDVENLALLARLELSEEEKQSLLADMKGILEYVKVVESVEVEDMAVEHDVYNVWREDEVLPREFSKELIVEQFPKSQGNFVEVQKIL